MERNAAAADDHERHAHFPPDDVFDLPVHIGLRQNIMFDAWRPRAASSSAMERRGYYPLDGVFWRCMEGGPPTDRFWEIVAAIMTEQRDPP